MPIPAYQTTRKNLRWNTRAQGVVVLADSEGSQAPGRQGLGVVGETTYLCRTARNRYFQFKTIGTTPPTYQLLPLGHVEEAIALYQLLPNQRIPFEAAFPGYTVGDA